jgi:carbon monoxide dehydrogenase subunit G
MPGVESIEVLDADTFLVHVTQRVGPISATFESKVQITEKVVNDHISFTATGKAIRGAIGNFRAESVVRLFPRGGTTQVRVESEAALAGVLGSIGQKIIARQAEKMTKEFANNLQAKLVREDGGSQVTANSPRNVSHVPSTALSRGANIQYTPQSVPQIFSDGWSKVAASLAAVNIAIGLVIIMKLM